MNERYSAPATMLAFCKGLSFETNVPLPKGCDAVTWTVNDRSGRLGCAGS